MLGVSPHELQTARVNCGSSLPPPVHTVLNCENVALEPHEEPLQPEPLSSIEAVSVAPHLGQISL